MGLHSSLCTSRLCSAISPLATIAEQLLTHTTGMVRKQQAEASWIRATPIMPYDAHSLSLSKQVSNHPALTKVAQMAPMHDLCQALCRPAAAWHSQACMKGRHSGTTSVISSAVCGVSRGICMTLFVLGSALLTNRRKNQHSWCNATKTNLAGVLTICDRSLQRKHSICTVAQR